MTRYSKNVPIIKNLDRFVIEIPIIKFTYFGIIKILIFKDAFKKKSH